MQNENLEFAHIQKLPLDDSALNLCIPRPSILFHSCEILPTVVFKIIFARVDSWAPGSPRVLSGLLRPRVVALPRSLHGDRADPRAPCSGTRREKPIKQIILGVLQRAPKT